MNRVTHISTFYSFKGGVGRTMLLANVGVCLARMGRRVLLWDLDVEAPGMHLIPDLTPDPMPEMGFLEWLLKWQELSDADRSDKKLFDTFSELVRPVPEIEKLSILPAFGEKADSAGLYQDIRWHDFLVNRPEKGLDLFRRLLNILAEKGGYDHIFLDARTGITDLGGFMTVVLPHATVLVGSYGAQNLEGLYRVYQALQPATENRIPARSPLLNLERLMVISPVPVDQEERRMSRKTVWDKKFPLGKEETRIEIPFDGRLLFRETLLALTEPESGLATKYAEVASRLEYLREGLAEEQEREIAQDSAYPSAQMPGKINRQHEKGRRFEEKIARMLTLLDYKVEHEQLVDGNRVDLIARKHAGLRSECYLVECKGHNRKVNKGVIEKFSTWLNGPQAMEMRAEGMVVARGFSPAALTYAKAQNISCYTPGVLERIMFDFGPYLTRLCRAFEESDLFRSYVDQRVLLEANPGNRKGADILNHAMKWVNGQGRRLWLLLGDYGTGKTSFFKRVAYELAKNALQDTKAPVPIAIDLKEFPNAISLEGLLQEHLRKHASWHGNPEILLHLLGSGRVVLLLDAFDEMGTAAVGRSIEDQFRQIARPAGIEAEPGGNRILITCRTHFFRDQQYVKDVFHGGADDLVPKDSDLGQLARAFDGAIDELMLFNSEQISAFLRKHLPEKKAVEAEEFISATYDLPSLAPRPVLLEMIVKALPELFRAKGNVTSAGLYHSYTTQWLEDRSGGSLITSPVQRKNLLEFLAFELWGRPGHRIHHREMIGLLQKAPSKEMDGLDLDRVDLELRTAAFLTRTNDGFYGFSHKSFREFFYARHLLRSLRKGTEDLSKALNTAPLTPECVAFLADLMESAVEKEDQQRLKNSARSILSAPYRPLISENTLRLACEWSRCQERYAENGASKRPVTLKQVMKELMPVHPNLQGAMLKEAMLSGAWLKNADFSGAILERADLSGADAGGAVFSRANLDRADLGEAVCKNADFSSGSMKEVRAQQADFSGASFKEADLTAGLFMGAQCSNTSFDNACCHGARFARAKLKGATWQGADLTLMTAPDASPSALSRPRPPS